MNRRQFLKLAGGTGAAAAMLAMGIRQSQQAQKHKWTYHRINVRTVLELSDDDALTMLAAMERGTWGVRDAENGTKKLALSA